MIVTREYNYRINPKYLNNQVWENNVDPDQNVESDQGLRLLPVGSFSSNTLVVQWACQNYRSSMGGN